MYECTASPVSNTHEFQRSSGHVCRTHDALTTPNSTTRLSFITALLRYCTALLGGHSIYLDSRRSAKHHFLAWRPFDQPKVHRSLEFHQQYYLALDEASDFHAQQAAEEADEACDDPDVLHDHDRASEGRPGPADTLVSVEPDLYECIAGSPEVADEVTANVRAVVDESGMQMLLSNNVLGGTLPDDECGDVVVRQTPVTKAEVATFENQLVGETAEASYVETATVPAEPTTEVTIELLSRAVANLRFRESNAEPVQSEHEVASFASVQAVSQSFRLNEKQHRAFLHIAVPLLHKIAGKELAPESCFSMRPLIITGAGGTGKTRIVEAVQTIARSWGRPNCVMATASSGIAAANLGGHTMHSSVKLGIRQKQLPQHVREPTEELYTLWDPALCVFADELSMTEIGFFGLWEEALSHVKNCSDPFGGLITVLMFDFFQLETISGYQLYRMPTRKRPFSELQLRGSWLYRSIDKVVYLTRNMRFVNDPEWGEWLDLARHGNWCTAMRAFLQQAPPSPASANELSGDFVQVISTDNAMGNT